MNITIQTLWEMPSGDRVCEDALDWFTDTFPEDTDSNGVDLRTAWDTLKASEVTDRLDWAIWFGCHWLGATKRQEFAWFAAGLAMRHAGITEYADNVTAENWRDAKDAAYASPAAYAAYYAANVAYAPAAYAANAPAAYAAYYAANAAANAAYAANAAAYASPAASPAACAPAYYAANAAANAAYARHEAMAEIVERMEVLVFGVE